MTLLTIPGTATCNDCGLTFGNHDWQGGCPDNPVLVAHAAFEAAENAWSTELRRTFGKRAGDARYRPEGKGEPGSALRRAHDARQAARGEWINALDAHKA